MNSPGSHDIRAKVTEAKDEAANLGFRIGEQVHEWRASRARNRGAEPVVVPSVGYGAPGWVRIIARALYKTALFDDLLEFDTPGSKKEPIRGWRSFTSIAISNADVFVEIEGQQYTVQTDRGGVLDVRLETDLAPGVHDVTMRVEGSEVAHTTVYIVPPEQKIGVISDIDDTVMVTALPRPMLAAWNSFVLNEHARTPTPGMSVLMDRIHRAHPQAPFMYLSTGAWNITPALRRFLSRNAYPSGTFLLTDWGPTPDRWFRSGSAHKVTQLQRLAKEFPDMKWILIGDDGQRDPDIYNGFAVRYPENVAAILIRNLTLGESVLASGRVWGDKRAQQITTGELWKEANDGATFIEMLKEAGLL